MSDQYIYDMTDTWNNGGTTYTGIKLDVTDSASASASKLLDLLIGGTTKFKVDKAGYATAAGYIMSAPSASKTANYTVLTTDRGKTIYCDASGGAFTITLPAAATATDGFEVAVIKTDSSTNAVTIDGDGAETINGTTTYALGGQYSAASLRCNGSNWRLAVPAASATASGVVELATNTEALAGSDTVRAVTSAGLASSKSLGTNGYMKLPGGLILQWGTHTGGGAATITYPTAFPTGTLNVVATAYINSPGANLISCSVGSTSTTQFVITPKVTDASAVSASLDYFFWQAIGH